MNIEEANGSSSTNGWTVSKTFVEETLVYVNIIVFSVYPKRIRGYIFIM
jgi:hypothetical protein